MPQRSCATAICSASERCSTDARRATARILALVLLAWLGAAPLAAAARQEPAEAPAPAAQADDPDESAPTGAVAPELRSPRAALWHYVETWEDPAEAARVLDVSAFQPYERGPLRERARVDLIRLLDRLLVVPDGGPPGLWAEEDPRLERGRQVWSRSPAADPSVEVELVFERGDDGAWRIAAETVESAPALLERVAHLPVVEGLGAKRVPATRALGEWARALDAPALHRRVLGVAAWQWAGIALLVFLGVLFDRIVRFVARRLVRRGMGRVRLDLDEDVDLFVRPVGLFALAGFFRIGVGFLDLDIGVYSTLALAASFVLTVTGVWAAYRLVDVACGVLADRASTSTNKFDDMLVPLLRRTLKIFVVVVGLVYMASLWTERFWSIVAGLSIGSIAIGFAARDSIENLFGTFTVLLDKPFQLGDWITMGAIDGSVEEVGFRSTRVRTFYDSLITVPNRQFIGSSVDNMGARSYRRVKTTLALTYDTPPEKIEAFCEGVRELIRRHPFTRKDSYHVYLNAFGPSSLDVLLYCFVRVPDWASELRERHRLFADVVRVAHELDVSFAFPTQTLHVARPEDAEHPGNPDSIESGLERGRASARTVVGKSLAGLPERGPLPPAFDGADPDGRLDARRDGAGAGGAPERV